MKDVQGSVHSAIAPHGRGQTPSRGTDACDVIGRSS
jgi:hypothetical protein